MRKPNILPKVKKPKNENIQSTPELSTLNNNKVNEPKTTPYTNHNPFSQDNQDNLGPNKQQITRQAQDSDGPSDTESPRPQPNNFTNNKNDTQGHSQPNPVSNNNPSPNPANVNNNQNMNDTTKKTSNNDKLPRMEQTEVVLRPISEEIASSCDKVQKTLHMQHQKDDRECNQKIVRPTLRGVPRTKELFTKMCIPLGLICQPFQELSQYEQPIPAVDLFKKDVIPRCEQCQAQINPWFVFDSNFGTFTCNLCNATCKTPVRYCDQIQQECKYDRSKRPELTSYAIDIEAPSSFTTNENFKKRFVMLIEKTNESVKSGVQAATLQSIRVSIESASAPENTYIAFIVQNNTVEQQQVQNQEVKVAVNQGADLEGFNMIDNNKSLLNLQDNDYEIQMIIDQLQDSVDATTVQPNDACVGAAVDTGVDFLTIFQRDNTNTKRQKGGGRILSFQTTACNQGQGVVSRKFERKHTQLHNNPENETEQKKFLGPHSKDNFWQTRASKCSQGGIQVDTFLFNPKDEVDMATQLVVSKWTGGEFLLFSLQTQSEAFHNKLFRIFSNEQVGDVAFKVRTSKELQVNNQQGNMLNKENSQIEIAGFDSDKALAVEIQQNNNLQHPKQAFFQVGMLHNKADGKSQVRVVNLRIPIVEQNSEVMSSIDEQAMCNFMVKQVDLIQAGVTETKKEIISKIVKIYNQHRINLTEQKNAVLVVPEMLRTLPLHMIGAYKNPWLKTNNVFPVQRLQWQFRFGSIMTEELVNILQPKIQNLNDLLTDEQTSIQVEDKVVLPSLVPNSAKFLVDHTPGQFLIDHSSTLIIVVIGEDDLDPWTFKNIFNQETVQEQSKNLDTAEFNTDETQGNLMSEFVDQLRTNRTWTVPVVKYHHIPKKTLEGVSGIENQMIEDTQQEVYKQYDQLSTIYREMVQN